MGTMMVARAPIQDRDHFTATHPGWYLLGEMSSPVSKGQPAASGGPETDELTVGPELGRELLDLALSADAAVVWSYRFADGEATWTAGLDILLGVPGAADDRVRDRLVELTEPMAVAAHSAPVWRDFELEQEVGEDSFRRVIRFRARTFGQVGVRGMVGLATDVTTAHQERQALADFADRYRLLVDLSPDAICVHENGLVTYVNPATVGILGAESSAQIVGRPVEEFVDPDSVAALHERIASLTTPGSTSTPAEVELLRFDGDRVLVESVSVRTTWEGRPAYQVIMRDITTQRAAEVALHYQAALVHHVSDAIIATTSDGMVTSWNPAAEAVYGVPGEEAVGREVGKVVGAPLVPQEVLAAGGVSQVTHRHADGSPLEIRVSAAEMADGFVLVCADETARRLAERHFRTVVSALDEGVIVIGASGVMESVNPAAERILGRSAAELIGISPPSLPVFDESGAPLADGAYPFQVVGRTGRQASRVLRILRPDGRSCWLSVTSRALFPNEDPPHAAVTSFTDITERVRHTELLRYQATHDELTGLPNRKGINELLADVVRGGAEQLAVLFCDIDNFKRVNDSLGHEAGDELLAALARRLRGGLPKGCTAARLSGDEFLVICTDVDAVGGLDALTTWAAELLRTVVPVRHQLVSVSASVGAATLTGTMTIDDLLRHADVAMFNAKKHGPGRISLASDDLVSSVEGQLRLEGQLRDAMDRDELAVHYQPMVARDGSLVMAEALVRWPHPEHGLLAPDTILPVAEQGNLQRKLDIWVLRTALREASTWPADGPRIAVNLASLLPDDPTFVDTVTAIIDTCGIDRNRVVLEMVESALMDLPSGLRAAMAELAEHGIRFAVDDFGTGHSSLARLKDLPAQIIKLDRRFVYGVDSDPADCAIAKAVVDLARAMGRLCVAEGVETISQFRFLEKLGIDVYQGWLFAGSVPPEDFRAMTGQRLRVVDDLR
jgi:diguanylate cyclase (GGDEF)-like protein/PAS domain S-box-containing protein